MFRAVRDGAPRRDFDSKPRRQTRRPGVDASGPCTPRRRDPTGRLVDARDSGPGAPAAPAGDRLRLLPSGPDLVRGPAPRGTRAIDAPIGGATGAEAPRRGFSPARADCGCRAPLPPRLARSATIVARGGRFTLGCPAVTYSRRLPTIPAHSPRASAGFAALGAAVLIAGCGSADRARSPSATRTRPTKRSPRQHAGELDQHEPDRNRGGKTPTTGPLSKEPT